MTQIHLNLNNFFGFKQLISLFPESNQYEFTSDKIFRLKNHIVCACGKMMVHNGYDYARKKGFGKVRIGKQFCKSCLNQHHEDKSFWKKLLLQWQEITTSVILTLRDSHVSWEVIHKIMNFLIPCSKGKAMSLFDTQMDQFEYTQDNYVIVNYDEQHPKKGRTQKYRLTLLNYQTKIPIADCLFDNKNDETIKLFLQENLDINKELIIITDCDRRYPQIFKDLWGKRVIHQKCLLHLNKLIVKDFGKVYTLQDEYNKYLLLNIFYNRKKELKFLEKLLKKQDLKSFIDDKSKRKWLIEKLEQFRDYLKELENERRRKSKKMHQRPLWQAKKIFDELVQQEPLFSKIIRKRLKMIKENWKYFTAFYSVKDCPATNNAVENFYSTSLKMHRKKQLRTDKGLINHMKLAALKRTNNFTIAKRSFLEIYQSVLLLVT